MCDIGDAVPDTESCLSYLLTNTVLEKFILVMKEELDKAYTEISILKQKLIKLEPPPIMFCIQGGDLCCRFFLSVVSHCCTDVSLIASALNHWVAMKSSLLKRKRFPVANIIS